MVDGTFFEPWAAVRCHTASGVLPHTLVRDCLMHGFPLDLLLINTMDQNIMVIFSLKSLAFF